jgi:hypothetical protein
MGWHELMNGSILAGVASGTCMANGHGLNSSVAGLQQLVTHVGCVSMPFAHHIATPIGAHRCNLVLTIDNIALTPCPACSSHPLQLVAAPGWSNGRDVGTWAKRIFRAYALRLQEGSQVCLQSLQPSWQAADSLCR